MDTTEDTINQKSLEVDSETLKSSQNYYKECVIDELKSVQNELPECKEDIMPPTTSTKNTVNFDDDKNLSVSCSSDFVTTVEENMETESKTRQMETKQTESKQIVTQQIESSEEDIDREFLEFLIELNEVKLAKMKIADLRFLAGKLDIDIEDFGRKKSKKELSKDILKFKNDISKDLHEYIEKNV